MKTTSHSIRRFIAAFTLIELLVVIAIIGILAALLFPAINKAKVAAQKGQAKTDMSNLGMAIKSYESDYNGRLPAPGIATGLQDVTYGYRTPSTLSNPGHYSVANNREVIAVLLNLAKFPDGTVTSNAGNIYNPRGLTPLNAKYAKDIASAGVGPDGEYRDPWGNSYVISLDTSLNGRTRDEVYARFNVSLDSGSKGLNGLSSTNTSPTTTDQFEHAGQYMIWSPGLDKSASATEKADKGVNRDNVLGWQ